MNRLTRTLLPCAVLLSIWNAAPSEAQVGLTASSSQNPATVRPGQANVDYFTLQISITLGSTALQSVAFANATTGAGGQAQLGAELGTLRLYVEGQSTVLATATASGGKFRFTGFSAPINAGLFGTTVRFHVLGNVPLGARDSDALDLKILAASDMTFSSGTAGGTYPLDPAGAFPVDGMVAAQISVTDMRLPILYALAYPERPASSLTFDLAALRHLDFEEPDFKRFPCLRLAFEAADKGGAHCIALNAADEVAVDAFLDRRIPFTGIPDTIEKVLASTPEAHPATIAEVLAEDRQARERAAKLVS